MLSFLYNCVLFLYALFALPKFLWQWCTQDKYKDSLKQRFGLEIPAVSLASGEKLLWIHAVSMGETRAVIPLFRLLLEKYPDLKIVISSTTETGHAEAKKSMPEAICHFFLPFDFSWIIKKYMRRLKPSCLILVESDIWYHLLFFAKRQGASVFLINGKISERSASRFQKLPTFSRQLFAQFDALCVQNTLYRERFLSIGASSDKVFVTGNIKFDVIAKHMSNREKQCFKEELGITERDRILVIGSSHEPEEEWLLSALDSVWREIPDLKVLIVPRHPARFSRVASLLHERKIETLLYSKRAEKRGGERVILIDAMGLLNACYQIAEIAVGAGSFVSSVGGHNIFEPVIYHTPVLFGPHMYGQPDFEQLVLQAHAGKQVTLQELPHVVLEWLQDPAIRQHYVSGCETLIKEVRGSVQRTFDYLSPLLTYL